MSQSREALAIMDGATVTFGKRPGYVIGRCTALLLVLLFVSGLVITGVLVYKFASCPAAAPAHTDTHPLQKAQEPSAPVPAELPTTAPPTTTSSTTTPQPPTPPKLDVRLPRSVHPDSYNVKLIPFIKKDNFTFHGEVSIVVNVTEPSTNITLHVNDIRVHEDTVRVELLSPGGSELVPVVRQSNDTVRQFYILHLAVTLVPGRQYRINLNYTGSLNDVLQGFYRSSYTQNNQTRWIAATQFQPTDARRAFPCFDEPALKARFTISIARPKNMTSISNMPRRQEPQPVDGLPDYEWDHYGESVPMSTYLVAFVVSDFESQRDGAFSVWTRKDALQQAAFSLQIGPKILKYYEDYFQIKFPLPKIDMIALPDFAAGAMENWGLITYRETAMLYKQGVSTNSNKQSVATVVAHELAHQWFGNLVTPGWWTDLWLNEGFASYVEYLGVNAVEPSWKIMEQFVIFELQNVFALDALESSHQISIEVGHPDEINEIFDRISYGKGASIIRMMDHFLTTEVFKRGVTNYLNKWAYQSSTQNDLWNALTEEAHKDGALDKNVTIAQIMETWTLQTGFPVLTVTRDYENGSATLQQERFLLRKPENYTSDKSNLWWVPVTYTTAETLDFETTHPSVWLRAEPTLNLTTVNASADSWVLFNIKETGFYRVNYDNTNWKLLIAHLQDRNKFEQIGTINRAQLVDDAMNLARAGLLEYSTALDVTRYLSLELEYLPWKAAFASLGYVDSMLVKSGHYDKFKMYMLNLIEKLYEHTGFTDNPTDPQLTVYKRVNVLSWACSLGHDDCVRNSVTLFQNWRSTPDPDRNNPISPNLKNVVYCTALRVGGQDEWDFAWKRYRSTNVGSERDLLLGALGCSRETWILSRYLDWSVTENSGIRKQDSARVFASVSTNVIGQPLAFSFLRNQWDRMKDYLGSSLFTINNIVRSSTKRINTQFELNDLIQFAAEHRRELGTATRAVEQAIEQAEANVKWMARSYKPIIEWLTNATETMTS